MYGVVLWVVLVALLLIAGIPMWRNPSGGIPGYRLGRMPSERRIRALGLALTGAGVACAVFTIWLAYLTLAAK